MKIYRVGYRDKAAKHKGYDYFASGVVARAAVQRAKQRGQEAQIQVYEIELTRKGLLHALNSLGSHPENK